MDRILTHVVRFSLAVIVIAAIAFASVAHAQSPPAPTNQPSHPPRHNPAAGVADDAALADQIAEMRAAVARLQAALDRGHQAQPAPDLTGRMAPDRMRPTAGSDTQGMNRMGGTRGSPSMPGMGMMGDMPEGGSGQGMGGMQAKSGMRMDGMKMMGMMGGTSMGPPAVTPSALPGFPGASHLYHIGATGFFLDHPQHISLSIPQQTALNQAREQAALEQATFDRRIGEAEQQLWVLTAADEPDAAKIEAKVREVANLRADQRIAFIRAVGEAAKHLTDDQRKTLVGAEEPAAATPEPAPADAAHKHTP